MKLFTVATVIGFAVGIFALVYLATLVACGIGATLAWFLL